MRTHARVYSETRGGVVVLARVTPNASKDRVAGLWLGPEGEARLAVRVTAPPDKGRANKAALKLLAKTLALPKSAVSLTGGEKDRLKTFAIEGDPREIGAKIEAIIGAFEAGESQ